MDIIPKPSAWIPLVMSAVYGGPAADFRLVCPALVGGQSSGRHAGGGYTTGAGSRVNWRPGLLVPVCHNGRAGPETLRRYFSGGILTS